jgi:hypothetical protein
VLSFCSLVGRAGGIYSIDLSVVVAEVEAGIEVEVDGGGKREVHLHERP